MVHAATAFAKAARRRRFMACTSSIGPGALNMVTGAAVAHVNRLPVLLLPSDVFAGRVPDPVLQQVEDWGDGTTSASDAFRPVSRYFDRITRPEQIIPAFGRAMAVLTDPAECGPVTLSLCQTCRRNPSTIPRASRRTHPSYPAGATRPRGGGGGGHVAARGATAARRCRRWRAVFGRRAEARLVLRRRGIPVAETQAGKSAIATSHPLSQGGIGVSGTSAANELAAEADLVIAVGTRLQDFTTGSWALFRDPDMKILASNTQVFDATKHAAVPLVGDALAGLTALEAALGSWSAAAAWTQKAAATRAAWLDTSAEYQALPLSGQTALPSDAQVIGAGAACVPAERYRGLRCGWFAGGTAEALAARAAWRLSHGVWLLLHGL